MRTNKPSRCNTSYQQLQRRCHRIVFFLFSFYCALLILTVFSTVCNRNFLPDPFFEQKFFIIAYLQYSETYVSYYTVYRLIASATTNIMKSLRRRSPTTRAISHCSNYICYNEYQSVLTRARDVHGCLWINYNTFFMVIWTRESVWLYLLGLGAPWG